MSASHTFIYNENMDPRLHENWNFTLENYQALFEKYELENVIAKYLGPRFEFACLNKFERTYMEGFLREMCFNRILKTTHAYISDWSRIVRFQEPKILFDNFSRMNLTTNGVGISIYFNYFPSGLMSEKIKQYRLVAQKSNFDKKMHEFILQKLSDEQWEAYRTYAPKMQMLTLSQHARVGDKSMARMLKSDLLQTIGKHLLPSSEVDEHEAEIIEDLEERMKAGL